MVEDPEPLRAARVVARDDGEVLDLDGLGVRLLIGDDDAGGRFAVVEHPLAARTLGAPMHTHAREDEYSFVLAGRIGLLIGGEEVEAGAGDLVFKPRGVPHAFWNATDQPARLLEIISPAGFERFFAELHGLMATGDEDAIEALMRTYELDMDFSSGPELAARYGLRNEF
jgi:quercetin dioxygenase-like cupin family protein